MAQSKTPPELGENKAAIGFDNSLTAGKLNSWTRHGHSARLHWIAPAERLRSWSTLGSSRMEVVSLRIPSCEGLQGHQRGLLVAWNQARHCQILSVAEYRNFCHSW